ncbi:molybdenum ABC transporter ATP-binding protein ModC [Amphritea sp. 1_MG-2023]|uniref:molybdenum ABC transporter ATP-binding protein ModC n=1 Tax=Amphritea sp. 1_MG-2023 TaxID=3062670 RepID=UPI0026E477B9|nr:molybdenum ABC transporter ATP-binding protein ModC [Amphritea sp. 1_MG-2023]MDO6562175.1 molybdenum ABC transporter ATP-binding protein ModC [Amphritea sp. 1_MG-2023]
MTLQITVKKHLGELLIDTDLNLQSSGVTALFGRSGAGKTSLINLVAGLQQPDEGRIVIGDRIVFDTARHINLAPEKRHIGYVFQGSRLFPHYTVSGNLSYGQRIKDTHQQHVIAELLGIEHLLQRYPAALSGGEQQRVAIGRALLSQPAMLLMDEPLASLDEPRKKELLPYIEQLAREVNIPIIYVSHSLDELLRLADQMVLMNQGKVIAHGAVADIWNSDAMLAWQPDDDISVILEAHIKQHSHRYAMSCLDLGNDLTLWTPFISAPELSLVRMRIHARDISLVRTPPEQSSIRNIIPVNVISSTPTNESACLVTLQAGQHKLKASITRWAAEELGIKPGEQLFAQIKGGSISRNDQTHLQPFSALTNPYLSHKN